MEAAAKYSADAGHLNRDIPSEPERAESPNLQRTEPETVPHGSVSSWPRSVANADARPSLFAAFPAAGQPRQAVRPLELHTCNVGCCQIGCSESCC